MRSIPLPIIDLWNKGGPFIGTAGIPVTRVTVEPAWYLHTASDVSTDDATKLPFRWWQNAADDQVEIEVPNLKVADTSRNLATDAAEATFTFYNTNMDANLAGQGLVLGDPGHFTPERASFEVRARWPEAVPNEWEGILVKNALLRSYFGFGGKDKTIAQARADGQLVKTGVWLVDRVRVGTDGMLTLTCRDMAKLLIEQPVVVPLVPRTQYPVSRCRWRDVTTTYPAVPGYDSSNPTTIGADGFPRWVTDIGMTPDGAGYWVMGNDGGVFAYGAPFYGSMGEAGGAALTEPAMGFAAHPSGGGYWLVDSNGRVYSFGNAQYHGGLTVEPAGPIRRIRSTPDGGGYWLLGEDGGVFAFGNAQFYGADPATAEPILDLAVTPSGRGYWLMARNGAVFTFGDAAYFGGANTEPTPLVCAGLAARPDGTGYWITTTTGAIYTYGSVPYLGGLSETLQDPIFGISATPSGNGYVLVGGDGGVFSFGDAPFNGSLPGPFSRNERLEGNYTDYADIVKDLLRWSGWLFYGSGDDVYGTMESTGAYAEDCLPKDVFDKKQVIDVINQLKEIVGYLFFIDEDGAANFRSPNWWRPGNYLEDGSHTEFIHEIDENRQIIDYSAQESDAPLRSEIVVANAKPDETNSTTLATRYRPTTADALRGMVKPMHLGVPISVTKAEQELMAELVALHIWAAQRQGSVTCALNPAIQLDDQVVIHERLTAEVNIHHVIGVDTHHDVDGGVATMTLATHWLGTSSSWGITRRDELGDLL